MALPGRFLLATCFFVSEDGFLGMFLEDFTGLETETPGFRVLSEYDAFPGSPFEWTLEDFGADVADLAPLLPVEALISFAFFVLCSVIRFRATSLHTLSAVRDSKLSFFRIASSIRVAKILSFLPTRLVTFPTTNVQTMTVRKEVHVSNRSVNYQNFISQRLNKHKLQS